MEKIDFENAKWIKEEQDKSGGLCLYLQKRCAECGNVCDDKAAPSCCSRLRKMCKCGYSADCYDCQTPL